MSPTPYETRNGSKPIIEYDMPVIAIPAIQSVNGENCFMGMIIQMGRLSEKWKELYKWKGLYKWED